MLRGGLIIYFIERKVECSALKFNEIPWTFFCLVITLFIMCYNITVNSIKVDPFTVLFYGKGNVFSLEKGRLFFM